ncbi:MAG TPA: helix-turn-helix domain-containing protein [Pseudogracilibacillus sp.]|nr:helix-turn-helix domain-containing protein [Pseudogracilibacillus sp.]
MRIYTPTELAQLLGIKKATLRKYAIMLEKEGYNIGRNEQNHRYYTEKDVTTFRSVMTGRYNGITLEKAVIGAIQSHGHTSRTNDTYNDTSESYNTSERMEKMMMKQLELQQQQLDLLKGISEKLEANPDVKNQLDDSEKELLEVKEPGPPEKPKDNRGFFARLFNKQ